MRQGTNVDVVEISTRQLTKIPRETKIAILISGSISLDILLVDATFSFVSSLSLLCGDASAVLK